MIRLISSFFDLVYMKMIDEVPSLLLSHLVLFSSTDRAELLTCR